MSEDTLPSDNKIYSLFADKLWEDIKQTETFPSKQPYLAHYTTIANLESIVKTNEVWFSNPLFMNDIEEVRFGISEGARLFRQHGGIRKACSDAKKYDALLKTFESNLEKFRMDHAFDIYVFCLSEHEESDSDGLLSMWRGYGGDGNGAAIIFDTSQLYYVESSPLIISKVYYGTTEKRLAWIEQKLDQFADLLQGNPISEDKYYLPIHAIFERIKFFSIITKHDGFKEEKEWRVVYLKERDSNNAIVDMLHYAMGVKGVEPKLKLKIEPIGGLSVGEMSLEKIVHQIILGPSVSTPLAFKAVERMFEKIGKPNLKDKLRASTIPYRPI